MEEIIGHWAGKFWTAKESKEEREKWKKPNMKNL